MRCRTMPAVTCVQLALSVCMVPSFESNILRQTPLVRQTGLHINNTTAMSRLYKIDQAGCCVYNALIAANLPSRR